MMEMKKKCQYIKRDDVAQMLIEGVLEKNSAHQYAEYIRMLVYSVPSVDVAPVRHGRWIEYGENKDGTHNICCSVCDGFFKSKGHANSCYTRNKYRYCHNCGSRMDQEVTTNG